MHKTVASVQFRTREVCFSVEIKDDNLFENEIESFSFVIESFSVISHREDSRMLRVANSTSKINIMIVDNDRDIVIGFNKSEFTVQEDTSQELCVVVMRPTAREELNAFINITVATVSGSAGTYTSLSLSLSLVFIRFIHKLGWLECLHEYHITLSHYLYRSI